MNIVTYAFSAMQANIQKNEHFAYCTIMDPKKIFTFNLLGRQKSGLMDFGRIFRVVKTLHFAFSWLRKGSDTICFS